MDRLSLDIASRLRGFDLRVALEVGAETVALAGPSGAGKSTVLRAVAGLFHPERGRIALDDEVWFDAGRRRQRRPEERAVGLVFQEYALFPHLTVRANVAYGGRRRADELLERLGIGHLAAARPGRISGGERQRTALARALAREPRVLLLDEPMAALDPHTREGVRGELAALLRETGLPTLLVTHDFDDAAALADRVAVLVAGRVVQVATPAELVAEPAHPFVAALTGTPPMTGTVAGREGALTRVTLDGGGSVLSPDPAEGRVAVVVHPWEVTLSDADGGGNRVAGPVVALAPRGGVVRVRIGPVTADVAPADAAGLAEGVCAAAAWAPERTRLLPLG